MLRDAEQRIKQIEREATEEHAGIVRLCSLPGVADSTGKALPSSEKDATREGTMANAIDRAVSMIGALDDKFAGLKSMIRIPDNYVMDCADFPGPAFYSIGSLAETPAGNAPEVNAGDYKAVAVNDNPRFQILIMYSPRDTAHMYVGRFWEGAFTGWGVINFDKADG